MTSQTERGYSEDNSLRRLEILRKLASEAPVRDGVAMFGVLAVLNLLVARSDPGWMNVNPTPWLLLPLLLGGRYGIASGLAGAAAAALFVLTSNPILGGIPASQVFSDRPYFFLALLGAAAGASLVRHLIVGNAEEMRTAYEMIQTERDCLKATANLYLENEAKLQRELTLHKARYVSIPEELVKILSNHPNRVDVALLRLLERCCGVTSAVVLRKTSPTAFIVTGRIGASLKDQDRTELEELPEVGRAAIRTGQLVTCRHLWESSDRPKSAALAALPWCRNADGGEERCETEILLLIDRMDFNAIDWENFARIEAILEWTMQHRSKIEQASEESRSISATETGDGVLKKALLGKSLETRLNLPTYVILFQFGSDLSIETLSSDFAIVESYSRTIDSVVRLGERSVALIAYGVNVGAAKHVSQQIHQALAAEDVGCQVLGISEFCDLIQHPRG